jgi:hypothetical protein
MQEGQTIKSIVFSQFTQFLDLLDWRLHRAGIRYVGVWGWGCGYVGLGLWMWVKMWVWVCTLMYVCIDFRFFLFLFPSLFRQALNLILNRILCEYCRCVKLDGRMTPQHRATVIDNFNSIPQISVFLVSLKVTIIFFPSYSVSQLF